MPRYEFSDEKSSKFWEINVEGDTYTVRYGKIGTDGQTQSKVYASAEEAQKEAAKAAKSKEKKGYVLTGDAAPAPKAEVGGNPDLEAAIYENPDDPDSWAVYGDWLQSQEDPRGEAVAIGVALAKGDTKKGLHTRMDEIIKTNREAWLGKTLIKGLDADTDGGPVVKLEWRYGFLYSARVATEYDFDGPGTTDLLKAVLKSSSSRFLQELIVGITEGADDGDADFGDCVAAIARAGKRPSIRRLHMGDFDSEECEISWSSIGPMEKLLPILPNLDWMTVHGGDINFKSLKHPKLKVLTLETGGLPRETIKALSKGDMPALENLEIWLGEDERGGDTEIADLKGFFSSKNYPALKNLGLQNSEIQNDIAAGIVKAPILAQLKTLDLSMGTMTDEGAKALLEGADALKHLDMLTVAENFISKDMVKKLEETFKGKINAGGQDDYDPDDEDPYLYVSVGE